MGFSKELKGYFSSYNEGRLNIPQTMDKIIKESKNVNFFYDNRAATKAFLSS